MRNCSLWSNIAFEKEVISHSNNKRLQGWSLLLGIWKQTNLYQVFFFIILLQLWWPVGSQSLLFFAYVEIHQVRILGFDNYQRWFEGCRIHKTSFFLCHVARQCHLKVGRLNMEQCCSFIGIKKPDSKLLFHMAIASNEFFFLSKIFGNKCVLLKCIYLNINPFPLSLCKCAFQNCSL